MTATPGGGTSSGPVQVTLAGADAAGGPGLDKLEYRLDGGNWTVYSGPVTISGNGQHTLEHRATDVAGNVGAVGTGTYTITTTQPANQAPTVEATAEPVSGKAPLNVGFTASGRDPEGGALAYAWDFGDGATGTGDRVTHRYRRPGTYTAKVTVTDVLGATGTATVKVIVRRGNRSSCRPRCGRSAPTACGSGWRASRPATGARRSRSPAAWPSGSASRIAQWQRGGSACVAGEEVSLRLKPSRSTARRLARSNMRTLKLTLNVSVEGLQVLRRKVTIR